MSTQLFPSSMKYESMKSDKRKSISNIKLLEVKYLQYRTIVFEGHTLNYWILYYRMTVMQSMKLGIDINRHKEIIVKSVSAILLLLLKHFKVNHVYQFEFMSQHLVFANCIPLVLKFFNQNIMAHISSKNKWALMKTFGNLSETLKINSWMNQELV